ncbi:MAG: rod shape-determining protein MreD [Bacteroidetes bacterium]|nr:rod shape-determining protein MreD [Bacteroidota bacterium]
MREIVRNLLRVVLFLFIEVYILQQIPHLHRFISPSLYFLFLLWLPFSVTPRTLLWIGLATGLVVDYFLQSPGLHASACLWLCLFRPFMIGILTPRVSSEFNYREPSPQSLLWAPYLIYISLLTLVHHTWLVFLEWLSFGSFDDFLIKIFASTVISLLLVIPIELLFPRNLSFRTNAGR